jgi:hypothetical protein
MKVSGYVVFFVAEVLVTLPPSVSGVLGKPEPVVVSVLATHDGGPGGAAPRQGYVCILEPHAFISQEGARLGHVLQVVFAHVVGEDEDEVGFGGGDFLGPRWTMSGGYIAHQHR